MTELTEHGPEQDINAGPTVVINFVYINCYLNLWFSFNVSNSIISNMCTYVPS